MYLALWRCVYYQYTNIKLDVLAHFYVFVALELNPLS
jgi:hypothetical protein